MFANKQIQFASVKLTALLARPLVPRGNDVLEALEE